MEAAGAPPVDAPVHRLERLHWLSPTLLSGGEPHGDADFAALAAWGVKTIVSVDGARPDLASAARHGLAYVHIPIGYDAVPQATAFALTRVVRERPGPIYIHCHHGQHRGPAAAAIACIAAGDFESSDGVAFLETVGTGRQYVGLWRDVERFAPPGDDQPLPELCEVAEVSSFVQAMADIDRSRDHLSECAAAQWRPPADNPDLDPYHEAWMLVEGFREAIRHLDRPPRHAMVADLQSSLHLAERLHAALGAGDAAAADASFAALNHSCSDCHAVHRDRAP